MPGIGVPIVIGGGIQLASPNALQQGLFLSSITPPAAFTSSRWAIGAVNSDLQAVTAAGREDTTIGIGSTNSGIAAGLLRPDIIIGRNNSISHGGSGAAAANVILGNGINLPGGSSTGNVLIGALGIGAPAIGPGSTVCINGSIATITANSVVIGGTGSGSGNSSIVVIGQGASATQNSTVVIGQGASAGGQGNVSIGQAVSTTSARCIAIGQGHGCPSADMIKIGLGGANAGSAGQILIGNGISPTSVGANEICIGHEGLSAGAFTTGLRLGQNQHTTGVAVPAYTVQWKSALGTDIAAGSVTFIAPKATGNAAAGSFIFQTSPPGASGATLQTAATRLTLSPNGVLTSATPTAAAENLVIDGFGGAGQASIRLNNLTNGAGALVGTLNNSPVAGDPTFWIPVSIAGVVKFIPAW